MPSPGMKGLNYDRAINAPPRSCIAIPFFTSSSPENTSLLTPETIESNYWPTSPGH